MVGRHGAEHARLTRYGDGCKNGVKMRRLYAIRGQVSSPLAPPPGCAFEPRCDHALAACRDAIPDLRDVGPQRTARCILVSETANVPMENAA